MSTSPVTPPPSGSTSSGTNGLPSGQSLNNMFLQLLVAQLQNQDPTNPVDPSQFVGQLAQFSELSEVTSIYQLLQQAIPGSEGGTGSSGTGGTGSGGSGGTNSNAASVPIAALSNAYRAAPGNSLIGPPSPISPFPASLVPGAPTSPTDSSFPAATVPAFLAPAISALTSKF